MTEPIRKPARFFILLTALLLPAIPLVPCSGPGVETEFTYRSHPQPPFDGFAAGATGIPQPTWARSFLFVAWRNFEGMPLTPAEQKALLELWNDRLSGGYGDTAADAARQDWEKAAQAALAALGNPPELTQRKPSQGEYREYLVCNAGAWRTAAATLAARSRSLGAASPALRGWLAAQLTVFDNCNGAGPSIPEPAAAGTPAAQAADRDYQIASAHFYAGQFAQAHDRFRKIAGQPASPWAPLAPYLAARALIRQATVGHEAGAEDKALLGKAETELTALLGDAARAAQRTDAENLLNFVRFRSDPAGQLKRLAAALQVKGPLPNLRALLTDYTWLLDRAEAGGASAGGDEMSDWIFTLQGRGTGAPAHALERWQATQRLPWLIAALTLGDAKSGAAKGLLESAAKVTAGSPGYVAARFHRARLLAALGQADAARGEIDALLPAVKSVSDRNRFLRLRLPLARNAAEFLQDALKTPAGQASEENEMPEDAAATGPLPVALDADAALLLSVRMPLRWLAAIPEQKGVPQPFKQRAAQVAFTRAVLLHDDPVALQLAAALKTLDPGLAADLDRYAAASAGADRDYAGMALLIKYGGLRPYFVPAEDNADPKSSPAFLRWCPVSEKQVAPASVLTGESGPAAATPSSPSFLSKEERQSAEQEWQKLQKLGSSLDLLTRAAIARAATKPDDAAVADDIARLLKQGKNNYCHDTKLAHQAFDLLRKQYPKSKAAKETKYWY